MPPTLGTSSRFLELRKYNYFITVRWKIKKPEECLRTPPAHKGLVYETILLLCKPIVYPLYSQQRAVHRQPR